MKLTMKFVTQSAILALVVLLLPCVTLAQYARTDLVSNTGVGQNPALPGSGQRMGLGLTSVQSLLGERQRYW